MSNNSFYSEYFIVLEAIEEYCRYRIHERRLPTVKNQGLSIYLQIPDVVTASLYLLDEETLEFQHQEHVPDETNENPTMIFQQLIEAGVIGNAMRTTSISYNGDNTAKIGEAHYIAVPLMKAEGVLGLVILKLNKSPDELDQSFFMLCNIHSNIFIFTLENLLLYIEKEKNKENLDQLIAYRTLNLVQSKSKLSQKFEDLQSNLSMALPHEFRTPINQILGTIDYLIKYPDMLKPDEQKEVLADIKESAERLKRLTENYLFYANLSLMTTDLISIAELQKKITPSILESINYKILMFAERFGRSKDIQLIAEDAAIAMSQEYFDKIIEELLDNAIKYSEPNTPIEMITKVENDYLHLSITDNGRGMSKEQIEQIDAYMQFERKVYEQQGSGLGISIVTKLVDLHRGKFTIDSKLGEYTTISIKLPIAII
jgi:two-component system, sensor histidine kinase and response regulator